MELPVGEQRSMVVMMLQQPGRRVWRRRHNVAIYIRSPETFIASPRPDMALSPEKLFAFMAMNARPGHRILSRPPGQMLEVGGLIEL